MFGDIKFILFRLRVIELELPMNWPGGELERVNLIRKAGVELFWRGRGKLELKRLWRICPRMQLVWIVWRESW